MIQKKLIIWAIELAAILVLRAVFMYKRDKKDRPVGARVGAVRGRPVYRFPFMSGQKEAELPQYNFKPKPQKKKGPNGTDQTQAE